tara:strand:+ start:56 stop:472 length:417 start_codon:yes stop_codon:yes gene_type:complete
MITFLKKRKNNKTIRKKIINSFKKPIINIIDDDNNDNNDDNNDIIDDIDIINTSKLSKISKKFNDSKKEIKESILDNANIMKEMLIKTIDKHKVELCTNVAKQIVELYNDDNNDKNNENEEKESLENEEKKSVENDST